MIFSRRTTPLVGIAFCLFFLYLVSNRTRQWRQVPQTLGLGDIVTPAGTWNISHSENESTNNRLTPQPNYIPGVPKPPGETYSKILVVPKIKDEDTDWMAREIPDWQHAVYVADDPSAPLHPPKNKGHEVMVYLSYIIDHYDEIPDIVAFMHSHQFAWHNDEIFGGDAADMLRRLNPARVVREGYMNLRCTWAPGCPDWMHPGALEENSEKQEETMLARSWGEIFPDVPIPDVLAQPCCAQFAVSRERILATPKSRYIFYRDWILRTELSDYISGRVWEYLWHFVFTGENIVCAKENVCYCDGYGLCFGGEDEYDAFRGLGFQKKDLEEELTNWHTNAQSIEVARIYGPISEKNRLNVPEPGRDTELENQINEKIQTLNDLVFNATQRGADPRNRALEAGRPWKEGDGF
ncbi:hypothetical protein ASPWEDRAFT_645289 [Aspergillus wentii DTO 134E9]|uniref:Uncharacterized protein n=1 Tax=Aspergillus wentii DTO 134E9 TaxID=1073089 RepID=A0A1L9RAQ4_ASPWE|nr:uncharacterized protein ASPWEDRAFT_645289 [Aspergillus wentii DTO 134E9]KAI9934585.1 hypothetical protein MW887_000201 [Aspergillus wentii]OJJ32005.1 hypothetical protein ASPWEDRAFT_645289 [Aspergillus wentii DTO 134E9]